MTVTYTLEVSRARFWGFIKLLGRWRGSVYTLMYREMCAFLVAYYLIAFAYRYLLDQEQQRWFENFAVYCRELLSVVPITFILGFYLSFVVGRWWQQYMAIPWPDRLAIQISAYVQGNDERGRIIRRSLVRYLNLISLLTFQQTSTIIKCRFPTLDHMVEAGIMTPEEKVSLENTPTPHGIWWVPAQWFGQLAMRARKEGRIHDDLHLKSLIDVCRRLARLTVGAGDTIFTEMVEFRALCGTIWSYDWISVPLSYTQVVAIAVYSFFASCLFGRQFLYQDPAGTQRPGFDVDFYFPVFTIFQFVFYVGWLKVAEGMICPFGEDDDDFELNWIIDRNIQVSYLIVDQMHQTGPKPTKDALWGEVETELPYTQAAAKYHQAPYFGSTQAMNISDRAAEWNLPEPMAPIDEEAGPASALDSLKQKRGPKAFNGKCETGDDKLSVNDDDSVASSGLHSGDGNSSDDERASSASRQLDEKKKKNRLRDLLPGYSRTNIASRIGSKLSLSSLQSRRRHRSSQRAASPAASVSRKASASRNGRFMRHLSRASSPGRVDLSDTTINDAVPDSVQCVDETTNTECSAAPAHMSHLSSFAPIQIDVPPPLAEEPEGYYSTAAGSDTNPNAAAEPGPPSRATEPPASDASSHTSRSPLIPTQAEA